MRFGKCTVCISAGHRYKYSNNNDADNGKSAESYNIDFAITVVVLDKEQEHTTGFTALSDKNKDQCLEENE